jgi:ABC-type transport system substrate-binding protein
MAGTVVDTLIEGIAGAAVNVAGTSVGVGTGTPKAGGTLTVGITSDLIGKYNTYTGYPGFTGQTGSFSSDQFCVAEAVYDPLFIINLAGTGVVPSLALSATGSVGYTVWTIQLRKGVKFHAGGTFNAAAVVANYAAASTNIPVNFAIAPIIKSVKATGTYTVQYTTYFPYYNFPLALAETQIGFMADPKMLKKHSTIISGTGPFKMTYSNWTLGSQIKVTKNTKYWRKDSKGKSLPYLSTVIFKVIADPATRLEALQGGSINIGVFGDGQSISAIQGGINGHNGKPIAFLTDLGLAREPGLVYLMANVSGTDVYGNTYKGQSNLSTSHIANVNIRTALAYAINRTNYLSDVDSNVGVTANGIFRSNNLTFYSDPGYPNFDEGQAQTLVNNYKSNHSISSISIGCNYESTTYGATQFGFVQTAAANVGITLVGNALDTADIISEAEGKTYELTFFSQFGGFVPDNNYVWWMSSWTNNSGALTPGFGSSSLPGVYNSAIDQAGFVNFANQHDPVIQSNMLTGMAATSLPGQAVYWKAVNTQFGNDIPYIWLDVAVSCWAADSTVQNWAYATGATTTSTKSTIQCYSPVASVVGWSEIWI